MHTPTASKTINVDDENQPPPCGGGKIVYNDKATNAVSRLTIGEKPDAGEEMAA